MPMQRGQSLQPTFAELTVGIGPVLHFLCVSIVRLAVEGRTSTGEEERDAGRTIQHSLISKENKVAFFFFFLRFGIF